MNTKLTRRSVLAAIAAGRMLKAVAGSHSINDGLGVRPGDPRAAERVIVARK